MKPMKLRKRSKDEKRQDLLRVQQAKPSVKKSVEQFVDALIYDDGDQSYRGYELLLTYVISLLKEERKRWRALDIVQRLPPG